MIYPEVLAEAITAFRLLPGVGEKSAERNALAIEEMSDEEVEDFINAIKNCKSKLKRCSICGHLTDSVKCNICTNNDRKKNIICVVEDYKSVFRFEASNSFDGVYHVLNGLISPIDGVMPDDLNIESLLSRIDIKNPDIEIIIALKPSVEGETTTLYLKKRLEKYNIKISRLSYGIPMGVDIDYLDSITLDKALLDRKELA